MIAALAFVRSYWRAILAAVLLVAAGAWLYSAGARHERNSWLAKAAAQAQADAAAYATEARANDRFVRAAMNEQADLQDQLTAIRRITQNAKPFPILHSAVSAVPECGRAAVPSADSRGLHEGQARVGGVDDRAVVITLGAVWLWNAALTGQAAPAGACSIDAATGQASAACAGTSGISLDAAWDNHATNAATCALDRANHERLIDFINQREKDLAP
jgi:hypothetical protein